MWYQHAGGVHFECTGCGACCTGNHDSHYIEVSAEEQQAIRQYINVSEQWFKRRYLVNVAEELDGLTINKNGKCIFLNDHGGCRIYPVRPSQCRTYPFWPEIMETRTGWNREKKRCEGIGRGKVVSKSKIKRFLSDTS